MIASQEKEVLRVLNLVCQQKAYGFQRLLASVHVVAQEQVVAFWRKAAVFEQTQQIVVLAMDVTCKWEKSTENGGKNGKSGLENGELEVNILSLRSSSFTEPKRKKL